MPDKKIHEHLVFFYGDGCSHCMKMEVHLDCLEKEEGIFVCKMEVWNNKENEKMLEECDKEPCGGVPFFINKKTGKTICGEAEYHEIKSWAKGE